MPRENWNDQDAAGLSSYIAKHPKFLEELETRVPEIKTETTEGTAMSGARHAGAEDIIKAIKDMMGDQSDVRTTPFINPTQD